MYNYDIFEKARNRISDKSIEIIRKERLEKRIAELEKELAVTKQELLNLEKSVLLSGMKELEKDAELRHIKLSKKEAIIKYSMCNVPVEKIASTVGSSVSYVRKVISIYRKENGIKVTTKGAETEKRVSNFLRDNIPLNEIAISLKITPQYVYKIKAKLECESKN